MVETVATGIFLSTAVRRVEVLLVSGRGLLGFKFKSCKHHHVRKLSIFLLRIATGSEYGESSTNYYLLLTNAIAYAGAVVRREVHM